MREGECKLVVRQQWRTPRKKLQRGTQMSRKGERRIQQNGGAQRNACINYNLLPVDEITKHLYRNASCSEEHRLQNGEELENEAEGILQDGDDVNRSRTHCPSNQHRNPLLNCVALHKVRTCNGHKMMMSDESACIEDYVHFVNKNKCDPCHADFVVKVDEWLKRRNECSTNTELEGDTKVAVDGEFSNNIIPKGNEECCTEVDRKDTQSYGSHKSIRILDVFTIQTALSSNNTSRQVSSDGVCADNSDKANISFSIENKELIGHETFNAEIMQSIDDDKNKVVKLTNNDSNLSLQSNDMGQADPVTHCRCDDNLYSPRKLNASPDFSESDKNMMLMTPEELERMPESGIEFEESVGPKELEVSLKDTLIDENADAEVGVIEEIHCCPDFSMAPESKSTVNAAVEAAEHLNDNVTVTSATTSGSSTLATISISTDSRTNTTSIVINTKQGQQAFKINTTNVMQAAATLQPITLADLVDEKGATVLPDPGLAISTIPGSKTQDKTTLIEVQEMPSVSSVRIPASGCLQDEKGSSGLICAHTGRCKRIWTCPEPSCGKVYTKQCKLKVHTMVHSGVRPYKCEVEGCDWSFTTVYKLKRHLETHCGAKDYTCDVDGCSRRFTTIYNLNSHKKLHAQSRSIACPIESCSEHFKTRRKMELHLREHRGVDAPYKCPVDSCGKMYYTANSMASHLRVHQKANFQCSFEGCNKVFDKMSRYKVHMWKHTGERPYVCTFEGCSWAFSSASKLKRHMRKHTGERQYTCTEPGCGKSFMRLEHLQGHLVTHSGDKPFQCPHENCTARFTAKSSLYVHLKKHKGSAEKEVYPCPIENCDKKYNCKSSLRIHMLRYHTPLLADAGQLDYITLLANGDELQGLTLENYSHLMAQQNAISIAAAAQTGIATLSSAETGIVDSHKFVSPPVGEHCTITDPASNMLTQPVLVPTMVISEVQADTTLPDQSACTADTAVLPPQSALETLSTCVLQENNSGSARTDFCSNHLLINRARKRNQLQAKRNLKCMMEADETPLSNSTSMSVAVPQLTSSDVVLTSTAISFQSPATNGIQFIQNQLLSDDPPHPHGDLYQEDGLLTSMANELAVPISLLAEPPVTAPSGQGTDFGSGTAAEFTGTTINLQDLE